ncbi:MAG: zf-HC2 domain-containing protein [Actinomycetota bacterium]
MDGAQAEPSEASAGGIPRLRTPAGDSAIDTSVCGEPDCQAALHELDVFLDDELSDGARASIRHHLDECPECLSAFDFHAELKQVIHDKCLNDEMPAGLLSRIERCFDTDFDGDGRIG